MKIYYDQLASHLTQKLSAVYLLAGDEPLLLQEACSAIKKAAEKAGFTEAVKFHADSSFDWRSLQSILRNTSLFDSKQIIELQIPSLKLSDSAKTLLLEVITQPLADKLLVLSLPKLDSNAQKSALVKAIEKHGVIVAIWPLAPAQLKSWLIQRLQQAGFQVDAQGVQLLLAHTQGNLLAAAQTVEKLSLIYSPGKLSFEQIRKASSDHARFDLFAWVDVVLQGNLALSLRIFTALKESGEEANLLLWALTRELRELVRLATLRAAGKSLEQVLQSSAVWEKRKPLIKLCLQRHSAQTLRAGLLQAAHIDRMLKGAEKGLVWNEIECLAVHLGRSYV